MSLYLGVVHPLCRSFALPVRAPVRSALRVCDVSCAHRIGSWRRQSRCRRGPVAWARAFSGPADLVGNPNSTTAPRPMSGSGEQRFRTEFGSTAWLVVFRCSRRLHTCRLHRCGCGICPLARGEHGVLFCVLGWPPECVQRRPVLFWGIAKKLQNFMRPHPAAHPASPAHGMTQPAVRVKKRSIERPWAASAKPSL